MAAYSISEVVNENMATAARAHLAEWGRAMDGRIMIAFGGAAPLHAALLAHKLKLERVVIPAHAGVGSAIGFLIAPVRYEVVRSRYMRLTALDASVADRLMQDMRAEAQLVVGSIAGDETLRENRKAFMRYCGQGFEIAVELPGSEVPLQADELKQRFDVAYGELYGRTIPDLDVEILSWTLTLSAPAPLSVIADEWQRKKPAKPIASRQLFDVVIGEMVDADCYARDALSPGDYLQGPALVIEDQTTTFVATGFTGTVSAQSHLMLERHTGAQIHG